MEGLIFGLGAFLALVVAGFVVFVLISARSRSGSTFGEIAAEEARRRRPGDAVIGQPARDEDIEFVVREVDRADGEPGRCWCLVLVTATNLGTEVRTLPPDDQRLLDDQGRVFEVDRGAPAHEVGGSSIFGPIGPGERRGARVAFHLPCEAVPLRVVLHGSTSSRGVVIDLPEGDPDGRGERSGG